MGARKVRKKVVHSLDDGQPLPLKKIIGARVTDCWLLPGGCLFLLFDNGMSLMAEGLPPINGQKAVECETGYIKPGADFSDMEPYGRDPHCQALVGKQFRGIDADVLDFGYHGAMMTPERVLWVKLVN